MNGAAASPKLTQADSSDRADPMSRPCLVIVTTVSHGLQTYLAGQPRRLAKEFDVTLVTSPDASNSRISAEEGVRLVEVEMTRRMSPARDLRAAYRLYRLFRRIRPD